MTTVLLSACLDPFPGLAARVSGSEYRYLHLTSVLVSWGCHNKPPQPESLETIEVDSLPVLEAPSPKSRRRQGCNTPSSSSISTHLSSLLILTRTLVMGFWPLPDNPG